MFVLDGDRTLVRIPKSVTSLGLKKADIGTKLSPEAIGDLLACIAEGAEECLSNPEISDRLFISRKTVEHHVGNVLSKLGLRSRGEATAYAARAKAGQQ